MNFPKKNNDWLKRRNMSVFMTPRDTDVNTMDVERLARDLHEMNVTMLSFLCGGYITNYPTELPMQRKITGLNRDFPKELIEALRKYGIKAFVAIDLGALPAHAAKEHPDWCATDIDGNPYVIVPDELYNTCLMGGYYTDYGFKMVRELLTRYDADGVQLNNFGFTGKGLCYCPQCREDFRRIFGEEIPAEKDWNDPVFRQFLRWREMKTNEGAERMRRMVKDVRPDLPFMGNSACFGDPGWVLGSSIDKEGVAEFEDIVKVEAQTRIKSNVDQDHVDWQWIHWTGEEASYLTSVIDDKPVYVVASYFIAWPYRRMAIPPAEQKAYFAQTVANGAWPALNLSGGAPADHDDKRGFKAIKELYGFIATNREYLDNEQSAATVAIVYSQPTLLHYGDELAPRYVESIRGVEQSLIEAHIPFDIISNRTLLDKNKLQRYRTLIMPSMACMSEAEADAVRQYVQDGGGLVATYETSLFDAEGNPRDNFLLSDLFRADYTGRTLPLNEGDRLKRQTYMKIMERHPILTGLDEISLLPMQGTYCDVEVKPIRDLSDDKGDGVAIPLRRYPAYLLNPEGFAFPRDTEAVDPMSIITEHPNGGRVVYFNGRPDQSFWKIGFPDLGKLIANAADWTSGGRDVLIDGPKTLYTTFRKQEERRMVHMVNMTGCRRFFDEVVPLQQIRVRLRKQTHFPVERAFLLDRKQELPVQVVTVEAGETDRIGSQVNNNEWIEVIVPELIDYDVLVFEGGKV